uniref:Acylphosphatase 2, muscle type n=1 Tax=Neolamprologus brichardi TaxID=32507 RepID=A0A3Q4IC81_NEOBR
MTYVGAVFNGVTILILGEFYTEDHGRSLGLSGWVKNTRQGTVIGQVQGPWDKVSDMKHWLKSVGSPSSRIDRAVFSNERDISKVEIHGFSTRY